MIFKDSSCSINLSTQKETKELEVTIFDKSIDKFGHFIIGHDLHNHLGELPDGIAEAFIQLVKSEKLSFINHKNPKE